MLREILFPNAQHPRPNTFLTGVEFEWQNTRLLTGVVQVRALSHPPIFGPVAELRYALRSERSARKGVQVEILPGPPKSVVWLPGCLVF